MGSYSILCSKTAYIVVDSSNMGFNSGYSGYSGSGGVSGYSGFSGVSSSAYVPSFVIFWSDNPSEGTKVPNADILTLLKDKGEIFVFVKIKSAFYFKKLTLEEFMDLEFKREADPYKNAINFNVFVLKPS